jgi:3-oxoacyl-[acyl-carrier protein] reductase
MTAGTRRVALITGASGGLGGAIALRLSSEGFAVALAGRRTQVLQEVAGQITSQGGEAFVHACDMADEAAVSGMVEAIRGHFGRLDVLVNNAARQPMNQGRAPTIEGLSMHEWNLTLTVNLTGAFVASRSVLPVMRAGRWGRIIHIGSLAGGRSSGSNAAYACAKAGLLGLSRMLAKEGGPHGITSNYIAPGLIETDMIASFADAAAMKQRVLATTPVGRLGQPDDVAGAVAYLAAEQSGFINGAIIDVNGGVFMP